MPTGGDGATLTPGDIEDLTAPHRRLLAAVGPGVRLSPAGYLAPALVEQLCPELDINPGFAGSVPRERTARPLAWFRTAMTDAGLLRTHRGMLLPTSNASRYVEDPSGLWRHLIVRLPMGRGARHQVGQLVLLALAAGVDHRELYDDVRSRCVAAGVTGSDGRPLAPGTIPALVWPTLCVLVGPRFNNFKPWPSWVPAAAAAVTQGRGTPRSEISRSPRRTPPAPLR